MGDRDERAPPIKKRRRIQMRPAANMRTKVFAPADRDKESATVAEP
jgi:hypothetical protein